MADRKTISNLTKALMLGAAVGTVGCAQVGTTTGTTTTHQTSSANALLDAAMESGSPEDVNRLMEEYPTSSTIAPLLTSLPDETLRALSPSAVRGLGGNVWRDLPNRVRVALPASAGSRSGFGRVSDGEDGRERSVY